MAVPRASDFYQSAVMQVIQFNEEYDALEGDTATIRTIVHGNDLYEGFVVHLLYMVQGLYKGFVLALLYMVQGLYKGFMVHLLYKVQGV